MEKSKTFRNLFAIIKWECYNKQTCRVEIDSAVILVLKRYIAVVEQIANINLYVRLVNKAFLLIVFLYLTYCSDFENISN